MDNLLIKTLYVHVRGDEDTYLEVCRQLFNNYRLKVSGEEMFVVAMLDTEDTLRPVRKYPDPWRLSPEDIKEIRNIPGVTAVICNEKLDREETGRQLYLMRQKEMIQKNGLYNWISGIIDNTQALVDNFEMDWEEAEKMVLIFQVLQALKFR